MTPHEWLEQMPLFFSTFCEQFAWNTGAPFQGMAINQTEGGWLVILRTTSVSRGKLVAFYGGALLHDCFTQIAADAHTQAGIRWRPDRYRQ